jgi:RimJ/RimL family protein N-acetyltransferase
MLSRVADAELPDPAPRDIEPPDTPRIRFRRLRIGDASLLDRLDRDPDVLRFIDWRPPSLEQQHEVLADCLAEYRRWPRHGRFVAESPDGEFLGWFSLRVDSDPAAPELGYRLRRQAWGRGLATEGARALVQHAFADLAAAEVHAQTMFVNQASRRVLAHCGLRHVETFQLRFAQPLPGTAQGEVRYRITRSEWLMLGDRLRPGDTDP